MNELDCNGWSPKYKSARPAMRGLCTDPVLRRPGRKASRFIDNGWYVGHDEPSAKFISNAAGSGNTMTYFMKLPVDPKRKPTANGRVTSYDPGFRQAASCASSPTATASARAAARS